MELNTTNPEVAATPEENSASQAPVISRAGALPPVAANSTLSSLWLEWLDSSKQFRTDLKLTLSGPPEQVPLKDSELMLEAKKASFRLTTTANERCHLCHSPEGELVGQADAKTVMHTSFNRMVAWMFVFPPINGGAHITYEMVQDSLQKHMITAGIDEDALRRIVTERLYFQFVPIAHGRLPVSGKPGYVEEYFPHTAPPREQTAEEVDENGEVIKKPVDDDAVTAPIRPGYVQNISQGTVIAHLFPVTPGIPGTDVIGTPLPCVNGSPATLAGGQNTTLQENGDLVSNIDGGLFFERGRFFVQPLYIVTEHLSSTDAPIDFDGDVEILGDVKENTVIHATGSVTVKGLVEAAMITADKDIFIDGGVLGDNRAVLRAKGKVHAKYLEYCVIYAGDDVRVGDVISSQVYSNGKIDVRGGRGTIIGGCMVAPYEISAKVVGSRAECATEIRLGEFPCNALRQEEYDEQIESIRFECRQLDELIAQLEQEEAGMQQIPLVKARLRRSSIDMRIEHLEQEKAALKSRCDNYSKCKLRADVMFPNTQIAIGSSYYLMEDRHKYVTAVLASDGEISVRWIGND